MFKRGAVVALILLFMSGGQALAEGGSAQEFLREYRASTPDKRTMMGLYVSGLVQGYGMVDNMHNHINKVQCLYCPPDNIIIQDQQAVSILERFIARRPKEAGDPMVGVMLLALADAFPCRRG